MVVVVVETVKKIIVCFYSKNIDLYCTALYCSSASLIMDVTAGNKVNGSSNQYRSVESTSFYQRRAFFPLSVMNLGV